MLSETEFKVNEFISLRNEFDMISIYVKGNKFPQSHLLSYNIPLIDFFGKYKSIDEAYENMDKEERNQEFQDQCLSLQEWAKKDYDTRLLHRVIAFPLLRELVKVGDPVAKRVFKEEISKKFMSGDIDSMVYLIQAGYLKSLEEEEVNSLYDKISFSKDPLQDSEEFMSEMKILSDLGVKPAMDVLNNIKKSSEEGKFLESVEHLKPKLGDSVLKFKSLISTQNLTELKKISKDYNIKGYSRYPKRELIDLILNSLSQEELGEISILCEKKILSEVIDLAIRVINGLEREKISDISIVDPETHEIKIKFEGVNREILTSLTISPQNIDNPPRDCNCRVGGNLGFCAHFWITFIYSLQKGYFKLSNWKLTPLPDDFAEKANSTKIKGP